MALGSSLQIDPGMSLNTPFCEGTAFVNLKSNVMWDLQACICLVCRLAIVLSHHSSGNVLYNFTCGCHTHSHFDIVIKWNNWSRTKWSTQLVILKVTLFLVNNNEVYIFCWYNKLTVLWMYGKCCMDFFRLYFPRKCVVKFANKLQ